MSIDFSRFSPPSFIDESEECRLCGRRVENSELDEQCYCLDCHDENDDHDDDEQED